MIDVWDINARALIVFFLMLIAIFLAYIAFNLPPRRHNHSNKK